MKVMVIYNARSGKKRAPMIKAFAERASKPGLYLELREIEGPGHGTELAREAVDKGFDRVISVGGDGTNNAIAQGLVGTGVPLGIVAMGSGNGYARSLGLSLDPKKALTHALTASAKAFDVGYLNEQLFLGTAGIGFDARVAHRFDHSKSRGLFGYAKIIVQEIFGAPPMRIVMNANEETTEAEVLMLVFCNTREFGNGANISPGSRPDDGIAELRIVRKPSFFGLIVAFINIYTGRADKGSSIRNVFATSASVWQEGTLAHLDGEPVVVGHEVSFRLAAGQLLVVG